MADKRLDQENVLTDFDYALIVKGNDVAKISKADLASVVGGLIFKSIEYKGNLDDLKLPGRYLITDGIPDVTVNYVYMQVFRSSGSETIVQKGYSIGDDKDIQRSYKNGKWSSFKVK